jgi:hypothetical protein
MCYRDKLNEMEAKSSFVIFVLRFVSKQKAAPFIV